MISTTLSNGYWWLIVILAYVSIGLVLALVMELRIDYHRMMIKYGNYTETRHVPGAAPLPAMAKDQPERHTDAILWVFGWVILLVLDLGVSVYNLFKAAHTVHKNKATEEELKRVKEELETLKDRLYELED